MEDFVRLFGNLLALVYHYFDRIVILGHLPLLTRPENIAHFLLLQDGHRLGQDHRDVDGDRLAGAQQGDIPERRPLLGERARGRAGTYGEKPA